MAPVTWTAYRRVVAHPAPGHPPGPAAAVAPGTDLGRRARELRAVHDAVLAGGRPPERPRSVVARSWRRVLDAGLVPDAPRVRDPLGAAEVERRRRTSPVALVVDELRTVLGSAADASRWLVVVTDADGVVLWRDGSSAVRRQADRLGFAEGATWTEAAVGTNAIGTALAEAAPVELFSAEHFETGQHPWYCTAAPLHDPRTGELLGVVDVSGPALTLHPAVGVLVGTAVRLAEAQLWRHHHDALERLRRATAHATAGVAGPHLLVDDEGWVAHAEGVPSAALTRVAAPREGTPVAVPGVGVLVPERLGEGWLLRTRGPRAGVRAVLVRGERTAELRVGAADGGERWRTPLSPRQAQLLALLAAAGPAGTGAGALSTALFGDAEHLVSVRAEVSRLRRAVGALVATRPYRVAEGVHLEVVEERA